MPALTLKPSHKAVAAYYESLAAFKTLDAKGVHIFDSFTGTGNFIVNIMQPEHLPGSALKHKYLHELHCNEVSLLPGIRPLLVEKPGGLSEISRG